MFEFKDVLCGRLDVLKEETQAKDKRDASFGAEPAYRVNTVSTGDGGRLKLRSTPQGGDDSNVIGSAAHFAPVIVTGPAVNGWYPVDMSGTLNASRAGEAGGSSDGSWPMGHTGYMGASYVGLSPNVPISTGVLQVPQQTVTGSSGSGSSAGTSMPAAMISGLPGLPKTIPLAVKVGAVGLIVGGLAYHKRHDLGAMWKKHLGWKHG